MHRLLELKNRLGELKGSIKDLLAAAAKDKRPLNEDETSKADAHQRELDQVAATIKLEEQAIEWDKNPDTKPADPTAEQVAAAAAAAAANNPWGAIKPHKEDRGRSFALSFGAFLVAVAAAAQGKGVDPRLLEPKAAASGLNTSVPSEAGYLVRTDFSTRLLDRGVEESVLAQRCTTIDIGEGADGLELPYIDETSRANGSRWGGVQVYRRAEADTVTATKPKFGLLEIRLEDLMGICYATDRSLRDAVSLAQVIERSFASEFAFKVDDEIVRGTGVGQCLGILNSPATVSQAAEGSQVADTVVAENVIKMRSRLHARSRGGMAWFINQEVEPQLPLMVVKVKNVAGAENVGGAPVYMPANGLSVDGYDTLFGKSVIPLEQCSAIGDVGDIIAANLQQYLLIRKGALETASSIHVRFLYGENTFRFTYRINGAPAWKSPLTPYKGTLTLSPFVTLAAR